MNQRKAGALLSYVYLALTLVVGLVYTPFCLSIVGESEYGVFAVATSVVGFLTILDFGFNQTMIRYVSRNKALRDEDGERRLYGLFLTFYVAIAVITLIVGVVLAFFIEDIFAGTGRGFTAEEAYRLKIVFGILLVNLVVSFPLGVYTAILNSNEGFVVLKLVNIMNFVLSYGGMSVALLFGGRAIVLAVITTAVSLVTKGVQAVYVQKKYKVRFAFGGVDRDLVREIFGFSFFIFLNIVIDQLYDNTDKFILGIVQGSTTVTIYTVGVQFSAYFQQFSTSISGVFLPRITALTTTEKDMKKVSAIFVKIGRIQFILLGLLASGFVVYGRQFVTLWVGKDKLDAYTIALVVMLPAMIPLSQNIGISVIRALNRHRFRSLVYVVIAVLNVGLSIPLAYYFGGFGAACATGLGTVLGQIITMNWFYYAKIGLDIPKYWKEVLKITLVIVPVCVAAYGVSLLPFWSRITAWGGWLSLLVQIFFYCIVFAVTGWLFIFNKYEKGLVMGLLKNIGYLLIRLIPMEEDVMFESHPDFTGNSKVIYDELIKCGYNRHHRIYWVIYDEEKYNEKYADTSLPYNVFLVYRHGGMKSKFRRLTATARCKYIIDSNSYVHKVRHKQVRLHLGHGMPIKLKPDYTNYDKIGECDGYLTCGMWWKKVYTEGAGVPEDVLLPIGYPRNDVLVKGVDPFDEIDAELEMMKEEPKAGFASVNSKKDSSRRGMRSPGYFHKINEKEKYILWMPTYRQHKKDRPAESDSTSLNDREKSKKNIGNEEVDNDETISIADEDRWEVLAMKQLRSKSKMKMPFGMPEISDVGQMEKLDKKLGEYGLMLYYRPHPAQDMFYVTQVDMMNVRIVDDKFLEECGVSLYELIRSSLALITDYSSVYFDYLLMDKPIGLTFRDWGTFFRDSKCVFANPEKELAGIKINSFADVMQFVDDVASDVDISDQEKARKVFHDVTDGSSTRRVMEWLAEYGMQLTENSDM